MTVCPICGVYVKKSKLKSHIKSCEEFPTGYSIRHLAVSVSSKVAVEKASEKEEEWRWLDGDLG